MKDNHMEMNERSNVFFISDMHFGHANIINYMNRPFKDIDDMNKQLINNINEKVGERDELWVLGDFSHGINREEVRIIRKAINCKHVHLIRGNHDRDYSQDHIFQSVQDYKEIKTKYGRVVLFHYPILEWASAHWGTIHLHGHIHSTGEYNERNLSSKYIDRFPYGHHPKNPDLGLRIYDVGVDANNYSPISIDEIAGLMGLK